MDESPNLYHSLLEKSTTRVRTSNFQFQNRTAVQYSGLHVHTAPAQAYGLRHGDNIGIHITKLAKCSI